MSRMAAIVLITATCLPAMSAVAQDAARDIGGGLPCALVAKDQLSQAEEKQLNDFVSSRVASLKDENIQISTKARDELASPLACPQISALFRIKYGGVLEPALKPLASGNDERMAVNALRLLGKLKITSAAQTITAGLNSQNEVIRFGAASACRELLTLLSADPFGFIENEQDRLLDALGAALAKEPSPHVADGIILALGDATKASPALRGRAMMRLTDGARARLKSLRSSPDAADPAWSAAMLRALDAARLTLFEQAAVNLDKEFAKRAGLLSGQVFAFVRDRLDAASASDASLAPLAGAAEGLAVIAHNGISSQRVPERGMQALVTAGNAEAFSQAVAVWIGGDGVLTKAPYGAPASDFAKVN